MYKYVQYPSKLQDNLISDHWMKTKHVPSLHGARMTLKYLILIFYIKTSLFTFQSRDICKRVRI